MKKIKGYIWPTLLALAVAIGIFIGGKLHFNDSPEKLFSTNSKKDKLNRLIDYIDYEYVDDVDTDSIVDVTVNNILGKLDPHSVYIPKDEMKDVAESMKGDFAGIGVSFYMYRDTITVIRTIKNGPSYISGIKPGDRILMADTDTLYGKRIVNDDVVSTLKGKIGTKVNLKVYRKTENKMINMSVVRDRVPIRSVEAYYMLTKDMGYIKINRFAESTFDEFKDALRKLKLRGAEKLTLDLRDNPGGYLGIAEKLADEFLGDDKLILFTKNKKGRVKKAYATKKGDFEDREVYVLINERSASASEIIAGALQDNDIGTIVGRRSFGKGLVQREMDLGDGSAVRLTVSRYYTPTGRSIQKSYKDGNHDYYQRFMERYASGELQSADSIKVADSLKFVTPKGKVVYGGGGIMPDIFIPIDTSFSSEFLKKVINQGLIYKFAFDYTDTHRKKLNKFKDYKTLYNYLIKNKIFDKFIDYCKNDSINITNDYKKSKNIITNYATAYISRNILDDAGFYPILNFEDKTVKKAIDVLKKEK